MGKGEVNESIGSTLSYLLVIALKMFSWHLDIQVCFEFRYKLSESGIQLFKLLLQFGTSFPNPSLFEFSQPFFLKEQVQTSLLRSVTSHTSPHHKRHEGQFYSSLLCFPQYLQSCPYLTLIFDSTQHNDLYSSKVQTP